MIEKYTKNTDKVKKPARERKTQQQ